MPIHAPQSLSAPSLNQPDHNFAPDFAWALLGAVVTLGVLALLYVAIVTWGGLRLDLTLPAGEAAPLSAYSRELAGLAIGGALVVLVARGIGMRTR